MRARSLLTLLIGLPLACGALAFLDQRLGEREAAQVVAAKSPVTHATVVVAARDLAPGYLLRADALEEMAWPADAVPEGAFASIEELLGTASEERRTRHAILSGEPVLATKIYGFRDSGTPGKREGAPGRPQKLAQARPFDHLRGVTP
jgi:pilus assembly protein CpaB